MACNYETLYHERLENPSPNSWKKKSKNPTSRRIRRIRQVAELLEAVQLDAFGRRDRGSLDTKRHPQVQQTLMDRLAKALGVEARERTAGERGREVWEKHLTTCWFLNVICCYLMFVGYTRDGTSRHGDCFVSQLQGSLLTNQFNDAGVAFVPEMLGGSIHHPF